jgi:putative Mg2+ transporter-C (MgtC) family protein
MELSIVFSTYVLPLLCAGLAGGLIGLEREFRGHPAGLRTHTLVSLTSAMLMVAAVHQLDWLSPSIPREVIRIDPARMAHGVLTGIGFLCGGVIFRQGLSVHGMTTAASLWVASAIGTLFGVGAYGLGAGGAFATLLVLVGLRLVDERLPQSNIIDVAVRYRREGEFPEDSFRRLMAELHLNPRAMRHKLISSGEAIELGATLRGPSGVQTNMLAQRLCEDPRITRFEIEPRND